MTIPRISIRGLLGFVAAIGVPLGVLLAKEAWTDFLLNALWVLLGTAILAAIYRQGASRAFWVGFNVFAWGYLMLFWDWGLTFDIISGPRKH